jgi:hypothetical protein
VNGSRIGLLFAAGFIAGLMNSVAGGGTIVSFRPDPCRNFSITANATSTVALLPGTLPGSRLSAVASKSGNGKGIRAR